MTADLSVVIPSVNSYADLSGAVRALNAQQGARVEIIVADRLGDAVRVPLAQEFPGVVILPAASGTTIPALREMAIKAATAPVIGVIEDHVIVPTDWARRMLDALDEGHDVVGGAIENAATQSYMDWSAFLCEYSGSLPPLPAGPSGGVPGNNVVYRTALLDKYHDVLAEHKWENRLHDAMRADGVELIMRPDIVVGHKMHYTFWLYFSQRYLYSRSYAGARVAGAPLSRRLIMGAAAFALPPLMFYRTISRVWSKRAHLGHLVRSLPVLALFCLSWGAGEVAGYWFGAGKSLSKVR